ITPLLTALSILLTVLLNVAFASSNSFAAISFSTCLICVRISDFADLFSSYFLLLVLIRFVADFKLAIKSPPIVISFISLSFELTLKLSTKQIDNLYLNKKARKTQDLLNEKFNSEQLIY